MSESGPGDRRAIIDAAYPRRRYALWLLLVVYTLSHVDRNIVGILVEPIKADLGLSDTQLGFISGIAFALFYATLGIPVAWLADRGNRRDIIALALFIWSGMTAVCGLAQNFVQLALARIGVGIGEAGSSPPSHSMIADLYPAEARGTAMAIYALGVYFGIMIGFFMGGWVSDWYGWRTAFLIAGLPGVVVAIIFRLTVPEPPRGLADGHAPGYVAEKLPLSAGFRHIRQDRAVRHVIIGTTLLAFAGYGNIAWAPAFLMRTHELSAGQVGQLLAPVIGIAGGIGAFSGGWLADRLGRRDRAWYAWVVAVAKIGAAPLSVGFLLWPSLGGALAFYVPAALLGAAYLGPSFALVQSLTPGNMRAMVAAIMLLVINLVGLGLGPQAVGIISDLLRPALGADSLRYALLIASAANVWGAFHYILAGRLHRDRQQPGAPTSDPAAARS